MKRSLPATTIATLLFIASCSKSNDDNPQSEKPTAKAGYDNSNYGYYKGVFVGSTGTVVVNIYNDNALSAYFKVDGEDYNFTTTQTVQEGDGTTLNFVSGSNSFTFTVDGNGTRPTITNLVMNGHPNAATLLAKETSTVLVKCYEGTYTGDEDGIFNALIYNNQIKAFAKSLTFYDTYEVDGTVSNNQIDASGTVNTSSVFKGTISGNNLSGTWEDIPYSKGNWSATRTY
jgi:hypothetical protein